MLSRKRIVFATIAALIGLAACSSSEGTDVAAETPTATEPDATPSADEPAGQTDPQRGAESQGTGTQPPAQPESGSQGTSPQPPAPPDPPAPDATTPEPVPDTVATPEPDTEATPEETATPTALVATVTVNEGVMEVSPECFGDTPVLTFQPEFGNSVDIGAAGGGGASNSGLVPLFTFTVENLSSIIFSTPTVHSADADLEFGATAVLLGTFGDVSILYQETQTWPDGLPLPSLRYFSPSNRFCFVEISFSANIAYGDSGSAS